MPQVLYEFAVSIGVGDVVAVPMVILYTPRGVGKHIGHEGHPAGVLNGVDGAPFLFIPQRAVVIGRLDPRLVGAQILRDATSARPAAAAIGRIRRELSILEGGVVVAGAVEDLGVLYEFVIKKQAVRHEAFGFGIALTAADPDGVAARAGRDFHVAVRELTLVVIGVHDTGVAARFQVSTTCGPAGQVPSLLQRRHQYCQ